MLADQLRRYTGKHACQKRVKKHAQNVILELGDQLRRNTWFSLLTPRSYFQKCRIFVTNITKCLKTRFLMSQTIFEDQLRRNTTFSLAIILYQKSCEK